MSMGRSSGFGPVNVTLPAIFAPLAASGFSPPPLPEAGAFASSPDLPHPATRSSVAKPATIKQFRKIPSATAEYVRGQRWPAGYYRESMPDGWWLPQAASSYANAHDAQFMRTLAAAVIIFTIAQSALIVLIWRYRSRRNANVGFAQPHSLIEILSTAATAIVFLGLLGLGARTWVGVQFT